MAPMLKRRRWGWGQDRAADSPGARTTRSPRHRARRHAARVLMTINGGTDTMERLWWRKQAQRLAKFLLRGCVRTGGLEMKKKRNCRIKAGLLPSGAVFRARFTQLTRLKHLQQKASIHPPPSSDLLLIVSEATLWLPNISGPNNRKFPIKNYNLLSEREQ